MKRKGYLGSIFRFLGLYLLIMLITIIPFSQFKQTDFEVELWVLTSAIVTIAVSLVLQINSIARSKQKLLQVKSDIYASEKSRDSLVLKTNEVIEKFKTVERSQHTDSTQQQIKTTENVMQSMDQGTLSKNKTPKKKESDALENIEKITDSESLKNFVEQHTNLKTNVWVSELIERIVRKENEILHQILIFNESVASYNTQINSFPGFLFKRRFGWKEENYHLMEKNATEEDKFLSDLDHIEF